MNRTTVNRTTFSCCLTLALLAAVPATARAELYEVKCYYSGALGDKDNDGYAPNGAPQATLMVERKWRLTCPPGYVKRAGDCNDNNSAVHPRRAEIGFNGVDDNCADGVDETEPIYYTSGYYNTTSSFSIRAKINDNAILQHASNLYVEVLFSSLNYSYASYTLPRQ
jgi:hypothetical protein